MHHSESTSESRRMSHPSVFAGRRGSGATVPSEDHQTPALMAPPAPAGSSSPHHPPHSLNLQTVGAQGKKKSGFQITSVLPAQVSASGNNSIADDTESYDDMDESHTEDLSSSDILDVSVSRATDTGVPVRSSSEETLNSLHGGETPGVTSPNEPVMHQGYMVNGVHHHKAVQGRPAALASTLPPVPPAPSGCSVQVETGGSASHSAAAGLDAGAVPVVMPATAASAAPQMSTASRFRVVKLDSNSEPFRKGRWTCTEYYEKDAPAGDVASAVHRAVESIIQSEHESTSSSSSGSTLSGGGDVQQAYPGPHAHPQDLHPAASVLIGPESVPVRPYAVEAQRAPPASASQGSLPPVEYSQMPAAQPLQIPPVQTAVSPRAAPVPVGIPGLPPVGVAQPVSPRPQSSAFNPEQQQHTGGLLSSSAFPPSYVTASQLEDAHRLLLQHHSLLSLPRLTAGGFTGLAGPAAPDAAAALGPDGGAGAFAVSAGVDEDSSSGASVVAIDNKIEQAMDLVKSHLMYAVREEVEVLKEQIKELMEKNSQLEQENALLKNLASPEQLAQFQAEVQSGSPTSGVPPALPPNPGPGASA
ncbi:TSC22 domain family protein 1 isoform X1 [Chanodichthys erythropterus]|uniref:TSC22 domain family protein 1 isoform X1 n=1 Tax=Chanodichthys erythropterus TaxID=933992 RepID=UPI00351E44BF